MIYSFVLASISVIALIYIVFSLAEIAEYLKIIAKKQEMVDK